MTAPGSSTPPGDPQASGDESISSPAEGPIQLPIEPVLDLHTFRPQEIKELVPEYLAACQDRGLFEVRIIHGKGIGNLRRTVAAILARLPEVVSSYAPASEYYGGAGATIVRLRPRE